MDLSSSISIETITLFKHEWHKAAIDGDAEAFTSFQGPLDCLLTPNQNTLLHLHLAIPNSTVRFIGSLHFSFYYSFLTRRQSSNQRSTEFVQRILNKCPTLLKKPNAKGEIPLHVAARFGHTNIVQLLIKTAEDEENDNENGIDPARQMLRLMDNEGDTAMHKAVQYGHVDVARELLRADPEFPYSVDCSHETPLYIAAMRGYDRLVAMILDASGAEAADHQGPCGRTALHAAAMAGKQRGYAGECTAREILKKRKDLVKARDENGRTPLHYAAHFGCIVIVKLLLECDETAAYQIDKDNMTALHISARQDHSRVMSEIIDYCPQCCEIVDKRGWNFLHFAAVSLPFSCLYKFFKDEHFRRFTHEKDIHGNTPGQVSVASRPRGNTIEFDFDQRVKIRWENLDSEKRGKIIELVKEAGDGEVAGLSVANVRYQVPDEKRFEKARETRAVVAALIATVAFAAAFTLPGGYKSDESDRDRGSAILSHDFFFGAFVIADSVAMIFAMISISFNYMSVIAPGVAASIYYDFLMFKLMWFSDLVAQGALLMAYITGLIAVLQPALALGITAAIIVLFVYIAHVLLFSLKYYQSI